MLIQEHTAVWSAVKLKKKLDHFPMNRAPSKDSDQAADVHAVECLSRGAHAISFFPYTLLLQNIE